MENRNRIEAMHGEIELPASIIHHIQSFLSGKQAAQTALLSKTWNDAWLTRPSIVLDQRHHRLRGVCDPKKFHKFAMNTIERYQELNLHIKNCSIFISDVSVGKKLIVLALQMGAVDLQFETDSSRMTLSREVLIHSKNLLRLCVTGCKVDGKVHLQNLETVRLCRVRFKGDIIWDLLSSSPLIVEVELHECKSWRIGLNQINPAVFGKLRRLCLNRVELSSTFFIDLGLKFPCLQTLAVVLCCGYNEIEISSPSLEIISFAHKKSTLRATFDVPRIQEFMFYGFKVPSLSFRRTSMSWESDVYITWKKFTASCFLKLNEFLGDLSTSTISLSLLLMNMKGENFHWSGEVGLQPMVENLMIWIDSSFSEALMDALFRSFHPRFIYQLEMPLPTSVVKGNSVELLELLCKTLVQELPKDCFIPKRNTLALGDLEEVNVEIFEHGLGEFQRMPLKMVLSDTSVFSETRYRFKLEWEPVLLRSNDSSFKTVHNRKHY